MMYSKATRAKYWPMIEMTSASPSTSSTSTAMIAAAGAISMPNRRSAAPRSILTTVCILKSVAPWMDSVTMPRMMALERRLARSMISRENAQARTPPSHRASAPFSPATPQLVEMADSCAAVAAMMASVAGHRATAIFTVNLHVGAKMSTPRHIRLSEGSLMPGFCSVRSATRPEKRLRMPSALRRRMFTSRFSVAACIVSTGKNRT